MGMTDRAPAREATTQDTGAKDLDYELFEQIRCHSISGLHITMSQGHQNFRQKTTTKNERWTVDTGLLGAVKVDKELGGQRNFMLVSSEPPIVGTRNKQKEWKETQD